MELSAILRIEEWARAAMTLNHAAIRDGSESVAALPSGVDIRDLEIYAEHRRRFRGVFNTSSVASWVAYVQCLATADPFRAGVPCFIDAEKALASIALDLLTREGRPGHCQNQAIVNLKPVALYAALCELDGLALGQREMVDFLGDWRNAWIAYSDGLEVLGGMATLAALRQIDIKAHAVTGSETGNMSETRSSFASIEATSRTALPASFYFSVKPYAELTERTVIADLHIIPNDKAPTLKLRIRGRDELREAIAVEFGELVAAKLQAAKLDVLPVIGTFTP